MYIENSCSEILIFVTSWFFEYKTCTGRILTEKRKKSGLSERKIQLWWNFYDYQFVVSMKKKNPCG